MNHPLVGGASRLRHRENIYTSVDDGIIMNFSIEEWDKISECFLKMFQGLGSIETSQEMLQFTSIEPHVATGISLSRQGKMAANMPLHNLDSTFHQVAFDDLLESLALIGDGFHYTYRIPREILSMRSD
ncbi:MAG: hypothetical protein VX115_02930 [Candidatus Thermoplasmatota archaeon]|nr:hypothetical protein [Candidatus Thermoplasmatota archaeon]